MINIPSHSVLVVARPTPGDENFYKRWEIIGPVYQQIPDANLWKDITVIVTDQRFDINDGVLELTPNVKFICSATTGHTHLKFDATEYKIELVTLKGESDFLSEVRSVSEFTFAMILRLMRPLDWYGSRLSGKRIGIIGLGRIGKQVKDLAKAFHMIPVSYDIMDAKSDLTQLFRTCDIVTLHASENSDGKRIVTKELLLHMKKTAIFINTARGSLVDDEALAEVLNAGQIAGAAVDVVGVSQFLNESTKNLIISDHIAGSTIEDRIKTDQFLCEKLRRKMSH